MNEIKPQTIVEVRTYIRLTLSTRSYSDIFLQVGVWKGRSTVMFAQWLKEQKGGVIIAVDTFLGALEFWNRRFTRGQFDRERNLFFRHGYPMVYYVFLSNVIHMNVSDYVIPFPVPSRLAASFLEEKNFEADLVHIDAAHEYEDCLEDIKLWWKLVRPGGGVLMGDDCKSLTFLNLSCLIVPVLTEFGSQTFLASGVES